MSMPPNYPTGIPGLVAAPPPAGAQTPQMGQLFTVALLQAGQEDCACKSCQYLKRIRTIMLENAEASLGAREGDNPQP